MHHPCPLEKGSAALGFSGWFFPRGHHTQMRYASSTAERGSTNSGISASSTVWGEVDGQKVYRIDLDTPEGFGVSFATYGATLLSVRTGDKDGAIEEVTLQHDTLDGVVEGDTYYGATVGRVCNRIAGASFSVDGEEFSLDANDGPNCLHSGSAGFDKAVWRHEVVHTSDGVGIRFEHDSPDGEGGFPGTLASKVTYSVKRGSVPGTGELHTEMEVKYAKGAGKKVPTPVNLTNHAYWNLSGNGKRSVRGHDLMMQCDRYLPLDNNQIPTGEIAPVLGTFFDFTEGKPLGSAIDGVGGDPPGLDHCLVRVGTSDDGRAEATSDDEAAEGAEGPFSLPLIARLSEAESGRVMEVFGSQPSAQVYTANYLSEDSSDRPYARHYAVCLETQHFPDAVNHQEWADSVLLQPGGTYLERARHVFTFDGAE
ncbi:unnamed protein product [Scytosiphon promiscuus]